MSDGEHKDFSSTTLPLLQKELDTSASSKKLLVAVTLAVLVIAGSTFVYRARSYHFSAPSSTSAQEDVTGAPSSSKDQAQGNTKQLHGTPDVILEGSVNGDDADDTRSQADGNSTKERDNKSSRKKDRRKRGKDPLKEILKGKPKGKALEQLLESNLQTNATHLRPVLVASNKSSGIASNVKQHLSTGYSSGVDTGPELTSTQLADDSQKPRHSPHPLSLSTQLPASSQVSTPDHYPPELRLEPPDSSRAEARLDSDNKPANSPSPVSPEPSSFLPVSPPQIQSLCAASDIDGDRDPNNAARPTDKDDQALVGGLAEEIAGAVSISSEIESESTAETETTAGMSMTSSAVLSEYGVVQASGLEEAELTPVTTPASSEKSSRTPKGNPGAATTTTTQRNISKAPDLKSNLSKSQTTVDPWDWDGISAREGPPRASSSSLSKVEETKDDLSSWNPTPGTSTTSSYTSFSSAVISKKGPSLASSPSLNGLPNETEPAVNIEISVSAPGIPTIARNSTIPIPAEVGRTGPSNAKSEEEDDSAFSFPTLNPTSSTSSAGAGPSRIRSPLGDKYSGNASHLNSNISGRASPSTGARRRPPTPSRSHSRNPSNGSTPPPGRPLTPSSASASGESPTVSQPKQPTLSIQTQLASVRGALEASRLREEKNKVEMEKYLKELETMKWENANWRRSEIELHAQIRNLMHQLQIYASIFAANAHLQQQYAANAPGTPAMGPSITAPALPTPLYSTSDASTSSSITSTAQQAANADQAIDNISPASPQTSQPPSAPLSSHSPHPASSLPLHPITQPLNLHMLHMNGMTSSPGMLSPSMPMSPGFPIGPYPGAPPPFFPYAIPPHLQPTPQQYVLSHAQQQLHMQQMQQMQHQANLAQAQSLPSPHLSNVFSVIYPAGSPGPHNTSPHLNAASAGTSSAGSQSPDRTGSPTSRGSSLTKRRSRTRMQITNTNSRVGGRTAWEDAGDGWVGAPSNHDLVVNGTGRKANDIALSDDDTASDGGFNELLADAIFKRPANIRMRSSSRSLRSAYDTDYDNKGAVSPSEKASEEVEQLAEFTFPSLSNMGNIIYQSSVKTNGAYSSGTSTSSSLAHSPAINVSNGIADTSEEPVASNDAVEEERPHSLPPLMEQPEDVEASSKLDSVEQTLAQRVDADTTPTEKPELDKTPRDERPPQSQSPSSHDHNGFPSTKGHVEPVAIAPEIEGQ